MLRWTSGKDGDAATWNCDIPLMWDNHLLNLITYLKEQKPASMHQKMLRDMAYDAATGEIKKRKKDGIRWAVKETRERVPPEIKCVKCKDIIRSEREGKFTTCSCWAVSIDSTVYYSRFIGNREDREEVLTPLLPWEFTCIEQYTTYVEQAREARLKKKRKKKKTSKALSRKTETSSRVK